MGVEEFSDMLSQTVQIAPFIGNDAYGEATFGADVPYQARAVGKTRIVRDQQGVERVSSYTVYLNTTAVISPRDRLTLPLGYAPRTPLIVSTGIYPDEQGIHHTQIFLA